MNTKCCPTCGSPVHLTSDDGFICTLKTCRRAGLADDLIELADFVVKNNAPLKNPRHEAAKELMNAAMGADVCNLDPRYTITPKGLFLLAIVKAFDLHIDDPRADMVWEYITAWVRDTYGKEHIAVIAFNCPCGSFGTVDQSSNHGVPPPTDDDIYEN